MASNYTCKVFYSGTREFMVLRTPASNIQLVNLYKLYKECRRVNDSGYYGMNASFFNGKGSGTREFAILNIAIQDGTVVGSGVVLDNHGNAMDGTLNLIGTSAICWNGSSLTCRNNVENSESSYIPKTRNSWAQGGLGLYLGDRNWQEKYKAEEGASSYPPNDSAARTGILINTSTKYVHLFACQTQITVTELRKAMMDYAGLTDNGSAGSWAAIMTDGGQSVQLYSGEGAISAVPGRAVPQIIALKNKN